MRSKIIQIRTYLICTYIHKMEENENWTNLKKKRKEWIFKECPSNMDPERNNRLDG